MKAKIKNWGDLPLVLTAQDAALILGIHNVTLRRWLNENKIPAVKADKEWLISRDVLKDFIEGRLNHEKEAC